MGVAGYEWYWFCINVSLLIIIDDSEKLEAEGYELNGVEIKSKSSEKPDSVDINDMVELL